VLALVASGATLLYLTRDLTFMNDEWGFLLDRSPFNAHSIFDPHDGHVVVAPALIYKALLELFGMDSARPFQVVSTATFLASAVVLFAWLRRRVDDWFALGAAVLVLFLGAAWEDLLWQFQIGYFGSMATGLGALLALLHEDRKGDAIACLLLVGCVAFSSLGIPFAIAAAVAVLTGANWRSRAYLVVVPLAVFGLWWLGWGHTAESHASLGNLAAVPKYIFDSIAAGLSSLFGLATPRDESEVGALDWGRPLAALALALAGIRIYQLGRVPRWLWVVGALALSYWALAGFNLSPGRDATASRYQYISAVFILMFAGELVRGLRFTRVAIGAGVAVVALAALSNLNFLDQSAATYKQTSGLVRADLGAVEIARDTVDPGLVLTSAIAGTAAVPIAAGDYLTAVDEFGSPGDTPEEIAAAPEDARAAADRVLASALGLRVTPATQALPGAACRAVDAGGTPPPIEVGPGELTISGLGPAHAELRLRRFATASFPIGAGEVGVRPVSITIRADRSDVPWQVQLSGRGRLRVCESPAGAPGTSG
jgi:hypothetical protein